MSFSLLEGCAILPGNELDMLRQAIVSSSKNSLKFLKSVFVEYIPTICVTFLEWDCSGNDIVHDLLWLRTINPQYIVGCDDVSKNNIILGYSSSLANSYKEGSLELFSILVAGNALIDIERYLVEMAARVPEIPSKDYLYFEYLPAVNYTYARFEGSYWGDLLNENELPFFKGRLHFAVGCDPSNFDNQFYLLPSEF